VLTLEGLKPRFRRFLPATARPSLGRPCTKPDFVQLSSTRPRPPTIVVRNWFGRAPGPAPVGQNALQIFGLRAPAARCALYC